jgi:hypothetical protein
MLLDIGSWMLVVMCCLAGFYKLDAASFLVDEVASFSVDAASSSKKII